MVNGLRKFREIWSRQKPSKYDEECKEETTHNSKIEKTPKFFPGQEIIGKRNVNFPYKSQDARGTILSSYHKSDIGFVYEVAFYNGETLHVREAHLDKYFIHCDCGHVYEASEKEHVNSSVHDEYLNKKFPKGKTVRVRYDVPRNGGRWGIIRKVQADHVCLNFQNGDLEWVHYTDIKKGFSIGDKVYKPSSKHGPALTGIIESIYRDEESINRYIVNWARSYGKEVLLKSQLEFFRGDQLWDHKTDINKE